MDFYQAVNKSFHEKLQYIISNNGENSLGIKFSQRAICYKWFFLRQKKAEKLINSHNFGKAGAMARNLLGFCDSSEAYDV